MSGQSKRKPVAWRERTRHGGLRCAHPGYLLFSVLNPAPSYRKVKAARSGGLSNPLVG
jgi:hypothetical protein